MSAAQEYEPDPDPLDGAVRDPSVTEGVEHLQTAANEMIAAARTFLNVVEDVVTDRDKLQAVTSQLTDLFGSATEALSGLASRATGPTTSAPGNPAPRPRVRKIDVD